MKLPSWLGGRSSDTGQKVEKREYIGQWPTSPLSGLQFGLGRTYAEVDVSNGEASLQSIAFRSAVDLMASLVSELPFHVYSGTGIDRRKRQTPGYLEDPAGDGYGAQDWAYMLTQSWFLRGNAYGNILDQGPTGMLRQVDLYHPDKVNARLDDGKPVWIVGGREVDQDKMFHRRAFPVAGNLLGLSPVAMHADSIGLSVAATRFGKSWFTDGGHPGGILSNSEADMSDDRVVQTAKDRFMAALFGTREPVVLGRGWKFEQIQVAPEESQFLETQGFSEAQCARIMGAGVAEVLGYDTGGSMTYANVVDRDIALLKYAADRWLRRMERIYSSFLPRPQYALFDRDAFLDTNIMQKWLVNEKKLTSAAYTINEVRAANNDKPVEWGKKPFALTQAEAEKTPESEPVPDSPAAESARQRRLANLRRDYNPDQPRDPDGKFGSGGAGGPGIGSDIHASIDMDALADDAANADTVFGGTDSIQNAIAKEQGFTGLPDLGSKEDLDEAIADGGTELHRGFSETAHADQFKNGDYFASQGASGVGIYTTDDSSVSDDFVSKGNGGQAVRMVLRPGAKVATYKQINKKMDELEDDGDLHELLVEDVGRAATALGYDAYHKKYHDGGEVWIVLNRTALLVEE